MKRHCSLCLGFPMTSEPLFIQVSKDVSMRIQNMQSVEIQYLTILPSGNNSRHCASAFKSTYEFAAKDLEHSPCRVNWNLRSFKLIYLIKYGHPLSLRHSIEFHRHAKFPLMGQNNISHFKLIYPFIFAYESLLMLGKKYHCVNSNNNRKNILVGSSFPKQNRKASGS